jgi:hypothetical protein
MSKIASFRKRFKIDKGADLRNVAIAVETVGAAEEIVARHLHSLLPRDEASDNFRIYSLLNLHARVFEHAQGMLVAISTGSMASAEALARIVIEGSVNIMYLAEIGDASTLLAYFRRWLDEHAAKLGKWKGQILDEVYAPTVIPMIDARFEVVKMLNGFVNHIQQECGLDQSSSQAPWPQALFDRFRALGLETDYYQSYHRLSGASHLTGEDTLMWLLAMNQSDEDRLRFGEEAHAYSIMMSRIASMFFVDASVACLETYGSADRHELETGGRKLIEAVHAIARKAGVPLP